MRLAIRLFQFYLCLAACTPAAATEIIAHRGASYDAPENTLAAIRLAWEQKADAVEFDIYLSKDGHIVLMHDKDTKRTAGVNRKIADQTWDELKRLDVGSWGKWKGSRYAGERIPLLADALRLIPAGKRALIEVKCGPEIVPELKKVLAAAKLPPAQTAVISFSADVVMATEKALPELQTCWLVDPKPETKDGTRPWTAESLLAEAGRVAPDALNLSVQPLVSARFIRDAGTARLPVYVWTVDDPAVAARMIAAGAIGVTTNRPAWLREQLRSALAAPAGAAPSGK